MQTNGKKWVLWLNNSRHLMTLSINVFVFQCSAHKLLITHLYLPNRISEHSISNKQKTNLDIVYAALSQFVKTIQQTTIFWFVFHFSQHKYIKFNFGFNLQSFACANCSTPNIALTPIAIYIFLVRIFGDDIILFVASFQIKSLLFMDGEQFLRFLSSHIPSTPGICSELPFSKY